MTMTTLPSSLLYFIITIINPTPSPRVSSISPVSYLSFCSTWSSFVPFFRSSLPSFQLHVSYKYISSAFLHPSRKNPSILQFFSPCTSIMSLTEISYPKPDSAAWHWNRKDLNRIKHQSNLWPWGMGTQQIPGYTSFPLLLLFTLLHPPLESSFLHPSSSLLARSSLGPLIAFLLSVLLSTHCINYIFKSL